MVCSCVWVGVLIQLTGVVCDDDLQAVIRRSNEVKPSQCKEHKLPYSSSFSPLIKLRIIRSSITPRDVCSQAADAIACLLRSYARLYTLRRTPSFVPYFVPYFVLTSLIMHLSIAATWFELSTTLEQRCGPGRPVGMGAGQAGSPYHRGPQPGHRGPDRNGALPSFCRESTE